MSSLEFVYSVEPSDDDVARIVMKHYFGETFPVMVTHYHNGKYLFEGYRPKDTMIDVTPRPLEIDVVA
jgi:hypothetical protein